MTADNSPRKIVVYINFCHLNDISSTLLREVSMLDFNLDCLGI